MLVPDNGISSEESLFSLDNVFFFPDIITFDLFSLTLAFSVPKKTLLNVQCLSQKPAD